MNQWNRTEFRKKPRHMWLINLQQRSQEYTMGKEEPLQPMLLVQLDSHMQKNETNIMDGPGEHYAK